MLAQRRSLGTVISKGDADLYQEHFLIKVRVPFADSRQGKGDKDRLVMLPGAIRDDLLRLIEQRNLLHQRNLALAEGWI